MKRSRHPQGHNRATDLADRPTHRLPDKLPGRHRWVALASYSITNGQAAAHAAGGTLDLDDAAMARDLIVVCIDCSDPYDVAAFGPCTADDLAEDGAT